MRLRSAVGGFLLVAWATGYACAPVGDDVLTAEKPDPLVTYGCPSDDAAAASVTGSAHRVLCQSCLAYCHVDHPAAGGMNLEPRNVTESVIAVPSKQAPHLFRISPGHPEESYLVHKIRGTHLEAGGEGQRMPAGGFVLSEASKATLERWIAEMPAGVTRPGE